MVVGRRRVFGDRSFAARNIVVLQEAQVALNLAFGAILSAYVGIALSQIDNRPFDHALLARFFLALAAFILCLCVGNSVILRAEFRSGLLFVAAGALAALLAHHEAVLLGFEGAILRVLTACWAVALLGSNAVLTAINYFNHRKRT